MNKQELKFWAVELARQLARHLDEYSGVAKICDYQPLMRAIERAKVDAIDAPLPLPAVSYFLFDADVQRLRDLVHALSCFMHLLRGGPRAA